MYKSSFTGAEIDEAIALVRQSGGGAGVLQISTLSANLAVPVSGKTQQIGTVSPGNLLILDVAVTSSGSYDLALFDGNPSSNRKIYEACGMTGDYRDSAVVSASIVSGPIYCKITNNNLGAESLQAEVVVKNAYIGI